MLVRRGMATDEPVDTDISGRHLNATAMRHFAADDPISAGHFPGNPIVPGAVLPREVVAAIDAANDAPVGGEPTRREIRSAKFYQPVRPGDTVVIAWAPSGGDVRFRCAIAGSNLPAVTDAPRLPSA
jgi:3-hydroxymyristoyl/3-hydroxydecanoyl-(acyl carrier protein) dehydratase